MATAQPPVFTLPSNTSNVGRLTIRKFNCGQKVTFKPSARFKSRYQKVRDLMSKPANVVSYFDDDELDIEFEGGPTISCDQDDLSAA